LKRCGNSGVIELIFFILLGAGAYVGWNIGANDTANCIGTTVGCGLISFRKAAILVATFAIIGAMLQGQYVMKTISKGIVNTELDYLAVCVALICSGFFVTLATFYRIPTSTSQAIVGGVVGIGLAVGAEVNFGKFLLIAESWIICPVLVMILSFGFMHLVVLILRKFETRTLLFQHAFGWLTIASACYVAYSMGANNAGNAVGPIANLDIFPTKLLLFIGGVSIAVGATTYGKKVADTVGKGITQLDIPAAFVAQVSSAFGMHLFSLIGIPVSTSSAIVGAVVGVGLVKGARSISKKTMVTILVGWILTPTLAGSFSFLLYNVIKLLWVG
jgi:PiT family inorganic phosphate transporter